MPYLMKPHKSPNRMKIVFSFLLGCCCLLTLSAQGSVDEFRLGGSARILNDECIRLTPDVPYVGGSAWYEKPIDLSRPFQMVVCLVLGEKDEDGADGIAFVFHPTMRTGWRGEGMGFSGLVPSLGIEFDTYRNYHLYDPAEDHLSLMPNGRAHHAASMVGPVTLPNLEDGEKHLLQIDWDPYKGLLNVTLDNDYTAEYNGDLVTELFGGNATVFWGVTAATGRLSNYQDVCIKKLVYAEGRVED